MQLQTIERQDDLAVIDIFSAKALQRVAPTNGRGDKAIAWHHVDLPPLLQPHFSTKRGASLLATIFASVQG